MNSFYGHISRKAELNLCKINKTTHSKISIVLSCCARIKIGFETNIKLKNYKNSYFKY